MRVHVFRPQADAERTARGLQAHGFEPVVTPLFTVVTLGEPAPEGPFDALILTSGNAIGPLADAPAAWRELPVFSVGARTADKARAAGFSDTRSADGDRNDLITFVTGNMPSGARLLLVAGRDRLEDVAPRLEQAGFSVTVWTAYAAEAVDSLPDALKDSLAREGEAAALHYSPRGAKTFLALTKKAGLEEQALALTHVALSANVAAPLISAGANTVLVAEHPEETALFAALEQISPPPASLAPDLGADRASARTPPTIDGRAEEIDAHGLMPEDPPADAAPAADVPVPTAPPHPQREPRSRLPQLLLAGLIGGLIGGGLVLALGRGMQGGASEEQIAELRSRIDALQAGASQLPDRAALDALDQKIAAATDAAQRADGAAQAATQRLAALEAKPSGDPATLKALGDQLGQARQDAAAAIAALGQRVEAAEGAAKASAAPSARARAAARLALTERIREALVAGRPFGEDVAALAANEVPAERLAPLRTIADQGAPTREALLAQIRGNAALRAADAGTAGTAASPGWQDRLLGIASRIVTVRPADRSAPPSSGSAAQIEAALERGDARAAAQHWAALPEPARRASEPLGRALEQRAAAESALAEIAREAVAAMGTSG